MNDPLMRHEVRLTRRPAYGPYGRLVTDYIVECNNAAPFKTRKLEVARRDVDRRMKKDPHAFLTEPEVRPWM